MYQGVVTFQQITPAAVAEARRHFGGANDVSGQDGGQDAVRLTL
jgi:hypothetical protein